jgi:uncharacterized protein (UPF0332 family)
MIKYSQLLDLARELSKQRREVNLRRAISTAYYGLFHCLVDQATCALLQQNRRNKTEFRIVYRSFDHNEMRIACDRATKQLPPEFGILEFCPELRLCARTFIELQKLRHEADYDPHARLTRSDAQSTVARADVASNQLQLPSVPHDEKMLFFVTLRFKSRT